MIDFYGNVKERINSLINEGYIVYFDDIEYIGNKNISDAGNSLYDCMISKMNCNDKRHCYNGALVDYSNKKILYMCDSMDVNHTTVLLECDDNFTQIDNFIDCDVSYGLYNNLKKISSSVLVNGIFTHYITSYYDFCGNLVYESISVSKRDNDFDLINNHDADKVEISYNNGNISCMKFNKRVITDGNDTIINFVNQSFDDVYGIFDGITYGKFYVKK